MPEIRLGNIFSPPVEITFEPWVKAWAQACTGLNCDGLSRGFWNSVRITVPSVVISIGIASVNGYALANWRFRGSELFFSILIIGAFIPYQVMIYPIVIILREIGIYGTLTGLVIVHSIFGMPILTLLFRNYFVSLPEELFKAARVDGAGFWQIFLRIMANMSRRRRGRPITPIFAAGRCHRNGAVRWGARRPYRNASGATMTGSILKTAPQCPMSMCRASLARCRWKSRCAANTASMAARCPPISNGCGRQSPRASST